MSEPLWPGHQIPDGEVTAGELLAFSNVLGDAQDERPLQDFLAGHPRLLVTLLPPGREAWCFDRPRLGSEFIPDFMLATQNSRGVEWRLVELESPTRAPLTQAGTPSQKLVHAISQVQDWRGWIRPNIAYARQELGLLDLDAECHAYVIIGRRHAVQARHATRYRELSDERITVMTYDRLMDAMRRGRPLLEGGR